MKVQCQCGAKYAIDVTPEMAHDPVRFACPNCGLDLSGPINDLVRQELGIAQTASAPVAPAAHAPIRIPTSAAPAPAPVAAASAMPARLSLSRSASAATHGSPVNQPTQPGAPVGDEGQMCQKHRGEMIVEHCYVCRKPLCPKCMELFGYVCSPLCKARADSNGIDVPVFAGQKSVREAKQWRKTGLIGMAIAAVIAALVGGWIWYIAYGSRLHVIFSTRFPEMSYAGSSQITGKNQLVFLHGVQLARYDLGSKKAVWTNDVVTKQEFDDELARQKKAFEAEMQQAIRNGDDRPHIPIEADVIKEIQMQFEASLDLFVSGQNIWIAKAGKLTRYDWDTGKPVQDVAMPESYRRPKFAGDELLFTDLNGFGQHVITHLSLASGETHTEEIGEPLKSSVAVGNNKPTSIAAARNRRGASATGLPRTPGGSGSDQPLDPATVAEQAQNMPYANRVALPATLSSEMHQEQVMSEIKQDEAIGQPRASAMDFSSLYGRAFIQNKNGCVEWSSKLLEEKSVSRSAMKAPPAKSALNGNVSVANTAQVANEILNEMQRNRGGDVVTEDVSRYQVTVHRPTDKSVADWTGEIVGPPSVFEQKTVTVVAGGKTVVVLDKSNKKLWQAELTYTFHGERGSGDDEESNGQSSLGVGPCVEHGDALYVYDEATLTAFDLNSGNVRWRVPSIGIVGMFFDDADCMYVNSTTADLDSLKYSRQIDINKQTLPSVLRINCKTGDVLWTVRPDAFVSHVEGKFAFCLSSHQGADLDEDSLTTLPGMTDSHLDIRRLDPKTGKTMWDYQEKRAPFHVRFHGNIIELVFRKEVEVLKFISL